MGFGEDACRLAAEVETAGDETAAAALVTKTLGAVFGAELVSENLVGVTSKSWAVDQLTYNEAGAHREYGHPLLRQPLPWYALSLSLSLSLSFSLSLSLSLTHTHVTERGRGTTAGACEQPHQEAEVLPLLLSSPL